MTEGRRKGRRQEIRGEEGREREGGRGHGHVSASESPAHCTWRRRAHVTVGGGTSVKFRSRAAGDATAGTDAAFRHSRRMATERGLGVAGSLRHTRIHKGSEITLRAPRGHREGTEEDPDWTEIQGTLYTLRSASLLYNDFNTVIHNQNQNINKYRRLN